MALSPDAKERLAVVVNITTTVFHWGFIPVVLYMGMFVNVVHSYHLVSFNLFANH